MRLTSQNRCVARVNSREFGRSPCLNTAKAERLGLPVCNVHAKMVDRFLGHGIDYARAIIRFKWGREAA